MWEPIWASRFRYWLLTGEVSRSCLHSSQTRRVGMLNVQWRSVLWVYVFWCTEGCSESRIWSRAWRGVPEWCITKRVKRLAGNEIELGIGYRRSNLGQVIYRWQREYEHHRICRSQYEHPGSAIDYLPETCLGHVYIVLEPVGSARLMLRWLLYYEFICFDVPKEFGVPDEIGDMTRSL